MLWRPASTGTHALAVISATAAGAHYWLDINRPVSAPSRRIPVVPSCPSSFSCGGVVTRRATRCRAEAVRAVYLANC